jgi:hypothetical protein
VQPAGADTAAVITPPDLLTVCEVGVTVKVHVLAACVTASDRPATVSVADRAVEPLFALTV